jgi:streptogramin lyase
MGAEMAICSTCGLEVGEGTVRCTRCGNLLVEAATEPGDVALREPALTVTRGGGGEAPRQPSIAAGEHFAGYLVEGIAGQGGMGDVYRARDERVGRDIALKLIKPAYARDASFRERFKRESRLAAQIEHPNVVPVYSAGEEAGQLYIAMRYIEGIDLATLLVDRGRLDPVDAVGVVTQVAWALDAAHAHGLVHRDVKPGNVLLSGRHAYLTDFGLTVSAAAKTKLTRTGELVGTVAYVAPEQIRGGEVDGRADVYALAGLLHTCLTGRAPFPVEHDLDALAAHLGSSPPRPSAGAAGIPAAFDRVVAWGMAKAPERRPASAGLLAQAAEAAARGARLPGAPRRQRRLRPAVLAAASAAAAALAIAVGLLVAGGSGPSQHASAPPSKLGRPLRVIDVPDRVAVAGGSVWTMSSIGGLLGQTNPRTGSTRTQTAAIDLGGGRFRDLTAGAGALWTTQVSIPSGGVTKVDPQTGGALGRAGLAGAQAVAATNDGVWATATVRGRGRLVRLDPRAVAVAAGPVRTGPHPGAIAAARDRLWVADRTDGVVLLFGARSLRLLRRIRVGRGPAAIAALDGFVWVANFADRTLQRLDPVRREAIGAPVSLGKEIEDIALTPAGLWVAAADGTVTRLDPRDGAILLPAVIVGPAPLRLAPAGSAVWAASAPAKTVRRLNP